MAKSIGNARGMWRCEFTRQGDYVAFPGGDVYIPYGYKLFKAEYPLRRYAKRYLRRYAQRRPK